MKIVNTTSDVLKHQIQDAIAKAIETYRKDYPNEKSYFSRKRVLTFEKMLNEFRDQAVVFLLIFVLFQILLAFPVLQ